MSRKFALALLLLLVLATGAWAALTFQWVIHGTTTALLTPNAIANDGFTAASSAYNNTIGQTGSGYTRCRFQAVLAFGAAPNPNAAVYLWMLESIDNGATFADTPTVSITTKPPDVAIPITAGATSTRQIVNAWCPPGQFKVAAKLAGTGQTTNGSGNTISLIQYTPQGN